MLRRKESIELFIRIRINHNSVKNAKLPFQLRLKIEDAK